MDAVARDLQGLEKRLKEDAQVKDFLSESTVEERSDETSARSSSSDPSEKKVFRAERAESSPE